MKPKTTSKKKRVKRIEAESMKGVKKGKCVLIFGNHMVSGDCRFTAVRTKKKGGDAIFDITLIKPL